MLKNPFETPSESQDNRDIQTPSSFQAVADDANHGSGYEYDALLDDASFNDITFKDVAFDDDNNSGEIEFSEVLDGDQFQAVNNSFAYQPADDAFEPVGFREDKYAYTPPSTKEPRLDIRDKLRLDSEMYHTRLRELNENAENKHYILFFGQPAAGKTWIIGSILHYMKNYTDGSIRVNIDRMTNDEEVLFYQLQDYFNSVVHADRITSTHTKGYFEIHLTYQPKDLSKPAMDFIFLDASGEHSEKGFFDRNDAKSGRLMDYVTVILESNVKSKLVFVYDQSLKDVRGSIPQINVLNAVFTHIQQIQANQNKNFPKVLLLSKADKIKAMDQAALERSGYNAMYYAQNKLPNFANSFLNESSGNKVDFYQMGEFSTSSDVLLSFNEECPAKLFNWLYKEGTGISPVREVSWWQRLWRWLKGEGVV